RGDCDRRGQSDGWVRHRLRGFHRFGLSRGHPQCLVDGWHRFQLAGRLCRRFHHSRGAARHANWGHVDHDGHRAAVVAEKAPLETEFTAVISEGQRGGNEMKRFLLGTAIAFGAMSVAMSGAQAKDVFALVPKNMNNPFFDQARDGCKKAEAESKGAFQCMYIGPGEHGGGEEQVQILQDLVAKKVDGIAVSPSNAAAVAVALQAAKDAGIPVLTWDSDLLPDSKGLRVAYIGTHNYEIGENLAKLAMQIKPKGGTICIQSGGAAAANHNERMQGIRDTLSGVKSAASPGDRLTGQNGWTEIDGCPLYTNDDFNVAVQQFQDIMGKNPNLDAFIPTGGFPQFVPDANRAAVGPFKDKIASGALALVVADTLPVQIDQMKEGLSLGQVGQRPFEMGYKTMMALKDMKDGKAPPADPTYTGLDVCTPETVATCTGK